MMLFSVERALKITEGYGTEDCANYRRTYFERHASVCLELASHYRHIAETKSYVDANLMLLRANDWLKIGKGSGCLYLSCEDDVLKEYANWNAVELEMLMDRKYRKRSLSEVAQFARDYLELRGLLLPLPDKDSLSDQEILSALARAQCGHWWRRQMRKLQSIRLEALQIQMGRVNKNIGIYASNNGVRRYFAQQARNRDVLAQCIAVNDLGQEFTLLEITESSISNPTNRRCELMTRIAGFEAIAQDMGHKAVFITLTAPSRFHSFHSKPCKPNRKYDNSTPKEVQAYFNGQWRKMRAKFHRDGITPYGFRVVEPHHDGCPHWHLLFFIAPEQEQALIEIMTRYALEVDGDEPGAKDHRIKVEYIDPNKGSAAGYIAKYISKNIDGANVEADLYGKNAVESAGRIRAWSSIWNIRQFQQIGGPPVTVWRELRRLTAGDNTESLLASLGDEKFQAIARAADEGEWGEFTRLYGGPTVSRAEQPIRPYEIVKDKPNRYDEIAKKLIGLLYRAEEFILTRPRTWEIKRKETFSTSANALFLSSGGANAPPLEFCQ